jgi:phage baseplate assembly protein W|tara:strand:+ start:342 stop:740 length:399 start_codon:yes stop_codon:yes gene_type:complete
VVQRISRAFKDISLSFDRHPVTNDILNIKNEDAIKKAVRNIVQTVPSERFFNPIFGSDVKTSLFEFVDFGTASLLEDQILVAIENYEPRINNVRVRVDPNADRNEFEIFISYNIVGQEVPPQQFSFILEATR